MIRRIWKGLLSFLADNYGPIIGAFVVAIPVGFSLEVLHEPQSSFERLIFAFTATGFGFLVGSILYYLKEIRKLYLTAPLKVYGQQIHSDLQVLPFIVDKRPQRAKLLEYSSSTVHNIVSNLSIVGCEIQLLLKHPEYAINDGERKRICAQIRRYADELQIIHTLGFAATEKQHLFGDATSTTS